ncbi:MAG: cation:proton antiporter [Nanoarchaeota archaeon]|nr:cation:proton antiporter [Nanoarchaeota archaeon]MBU4451201.1 cation:proton antiporter [Nanoarchaeota archaeon]MCG2723299.1 cation:proton antiporter [archaeon]
MELFIEFGIIMSLAVLISWVMSLLKQPLIIGYIISGIIVGPYVLNIMSSSETILIFSNIGIALLLFIVGLGLSPKVVKEVGAVSLITGVGQVIFTSLIGFLISVLLSFSIIESIYIAIALTFSSTIIIMKILSDKGDMNTLYGRISIGFLIVQDLIAIVILMIVSTMAIKFDIAAFIFEIIFKGLGMMAVLFLIGVRVLPSILKTIAKSQELLLLFSMGWCLALASIFKYLNFSMEIGALLAGVILSLSPYRYEISSKMKPFRDFFIVLFFILLGSQMVFMDLLQYKFPIILLSAFILIGNPLIVMILMGVLGYTKRNSFLAGLTVAQISEFSIILIALGVRQGHLSNEILAIVTAIGLITIAGSTYMMLYANKIYPHISKYLSIFERKGKKVDEPKYSDFKKYDIIIFGYNRVGYDLLNYLKKTKNRFLVIDHDPEVIAKLIKEGIDCRYGDADDSEFLNEFDFLHVKMMISTIPDFDTNMFLINKIRAHNKKSIIIVVSHDIDKAIELYKKGTTYVILPHFLGGQHTATLIEKYGLNFDKFIKEKVAHIENLKNRIKLGHEHPKHSRN